MPLPSEEVALLRDEALRKVGRNIVNFQKIETCLKQLVVMANIQGPLSTLRNQQQSDRARVRKKSLGDLAEMFHRSAFGEGNRSDAPTDLSEAWVSISMKLVADADVAAKRKRALAALVVERNRLIHHDLVKFDHNSAESCSGLIALLDAQNVRILRELNELKLLIKTFMASIADLMSYVESDEFLRLLDHALEDVDDVQADRADGVGSRSG